MAYSVTIARRAKSDLQKIGDWLHERSPAGARSWLAVARATIAGLEESPRRHSLAPENEFSSHEIRNALFKTRRGHIYRAVFYIEDETVLVTHIRSPRQRPLESDEV